MTTQHTETLIIGAGQAGLATGYQLKRLGRDFLIVDGHDRIGDNWRRHWNSLRLFTPAKYSGLPGLDFPGEAWSFPGKDDVADYLEKYAIEMDLHVRLRTAVDRVTARDEGGFIASTGADSITCDNLVVATGTYAGTRRIPEFAADLDPSIRQLHSSQYHCPDDLQPGPALVVGAANSGCEIALELAGDREVTLCGRDPGHEPFRPGSRLDRAATPVLLFVARHVATRRGSLGQRALQHFRNHGIPVGRVHADELDDRGVTRIDARLTGSRDGRPMLADGSVHEVANIVWCTGFSSDYGWIDLPAFADDGLPEEYRGVVEAVPGLFFCGLIFQYSVSSSVLPGVGRDAAYVADRIADLSPSPITVSG
jgi:putative flavoprotein involved in K+ transport